MYSKQKKYAEAEAQLRKLLATDPGNSTARVQLGRVLAAEGKSDEAATLLTSEQSAASSDPRAALELGTIYVKAGKYAEAEQQFRIAVQGLPQDAEAHYALGSVLMQEKQYPESQEELLLAAKLKPDLAEIYGNLAVVAAENKNYDLAIRALDDARQVSSRNSRDLLPARHLVRQLESDRESSGELPAVPGHGWRQDAQPGVAGAASADRHRPGKRQQVRREEIACASSGESWCFCSCSTCLGRPTANLRLT